jgi:hypothetical protein
MILILILSGVLIVVFNLESLDDEFSQSQQVAGYFIIIMLCLFLGAAAVAVG